MNSSNGNGQQDASSAVLDPTMSLVGRLEDLSLGEILQIVSLSKRSGLLRLESPGGKASLYIRAGKVIYADTSERKEGVLDFLSRQGFLHAQQLQPLGDKLESAKNPQDFRELLQHEAGIGREQLQKLLKSRVEELTYALFIWEEGTFSFQLIEDEASHPVLSKVAPFFLDEGVGAQFLVMEGARRKDEMMRDAPAPEQESASPMVDPGKVLGDNWEQEFEQHLAGSAEYTEEPSTDEDLQDELEEFVVPENLPPLPDKLSNKVVALGLQATLVVEISKGFVNTGIDLLIMENGADALTKIQELRQHSQEPFLLVDMEAQGITDGRELGGLEVISTIWDFGFHIPVGIVCRGEILADLRSRLGSIIGLTVIEAAEPYDEDTVNQILETVRNSVGAQAVRHEDEGTAEAVDEPQPATESASLSDSSDTIVPIPPASGPESGTKENYYDIQQEFSKELGDIDLPLEDDPEGGQLLRGEVSQDPHMARLSSYVNELNRQDISGEITLLALRFASDFADRAILFLVRKEDIKGLGQFGVELGQGVDADSVVRSLNLPLEENSLFHRIILQRQSYKGPPTDSAMENELIKTLGGGRPSEIFVGPVISMGKVAVLLYGDDYPLCKGLEPTHTLDIFLSHVGLALDRAFLEMKLKSQRP